MQMAVGISHGLLYTWTEDSKLPITTGWIVSYLIKKRKFGFFCANTN